MCWLASAERRFRKSFDTKRLAMDLDVGYAFFTFSRLTTRYGAASWREKKTIPWMAPCGDADSAPRTIFLPGLELASTRATTMMMTMMIVPSSEDGLPVQAAAL